MNINVKQLVYAIIAAYVAMSVVAIGLDYLLVDYMTGMKAVMRVGADLEAHAIWMYLGYLIVTIMFCFIYAQHHEGKGWMEGARFGLWIGLMMAGISMVMYGTMPLVGMESLISAVVGIIIYIVGGIVASLVYKK